MHTSENYKNEKEFLYNGSTKAPKGFKMPDGYLEGFEKSIMARIQLEEEKVVIQPIRIEKIIAVLAVAASLIWAAFVLFIPEKEMGLQDLARIEYMEENHEDYYAIDEYALAENLSMEDLENITFDEELISDDDIYEYVLEEGFSEFVILENL